VYEINQFFYTFSPTDTGKYYWRVKGLLKKYRIWSEWSETRGFEISWCNTPPYTPSNPIPKHEEVCVSVYTNLEWKTGDKEGDTVTCYIYFDTISPPQLIDSIVTYTEVSDTLVWTYKFSQLLDTQTLYFWKIKAKDQIGAISESDIWKFTTQKEITQPPNPPSKPQISPTSPEYEIDEKYTFSTSTTDPEGDSLMYRFDFGDGVISPWSEMKASGEGWSFPHIYRKLDTFYIKAQAKDKWGGISKWSDSLQIEIKVGKGACWIVDMGENLVVKIGKGGSYIRKYSYLPGGTSTDSGHTNFRYPASLDIDTIDGTIWVACTRNQTLFRIPLGKLADVHLHGNALPPQGSIPNKWPTTPCVDNDRGCWYGTFFPQLIMKVDRSGNEVRRIQAPNLDDSQIHGVSSIVLDMGRGVIWSSELQTVTGSRSFVSKYDINTGSLEVRVSNVQAPCIKLDPVTGDLWVADVNHNKTVFKITADGDTIRAKTVFTTPSFLAVDWVRKCVWVADRKAKKVIKLDINNGTEIGTWDAGEEVGYLDVDLTTGECWVAAGEDVGNGIITKVVKISPNMTKLFEITGFPQRNITFKNIVFLKVNNTNDPE
jgi:hypothetical protein